MTAPAAFVRVAPDTRFGAHLRLATFLFFIIPLVEMLILIEVGGIIGALPTVGLVVLTAVCGVWLLRHEGLATLTRVQEKLARGEIPETELLEGIMLIIGGALLLTPGFATDIAGFICLIPGLRRPLAARIIRSGSFRQFNMSGSFRQSRYNGQGQTIEGEFSTEQSSTEQARTVTPALEEEDKKP